MEYVLQMRPKFNSERLHYDGDDWIIDFPTNFHRNPLNGSEGKDAAFRVYPSELAPHVTGTYVKRYKSTTAHILRFVSTLIKTL
jgi:hypothetical protein